MKTIPVKYIDTTKYIVRVEYDEWSDSPAEWGTFTIVQFRDSDFSTYEELDSSEYVTESGKLKPSVIAKLKAGKMFTISYQRYSSADGGQYRLDGSIPSGVVDSRDVNGFIIFDDSYVKGVSYDERKRYAQQDLNIYTQWANGEVYYATVETESGLEVDSCGGLIGDDDLTAFIQDTIGDAEHQTFMVYAGTAEQLQELSI